MAYSRQFTFNIYYTNYCTKYRSLAGFELLTSATPFQHTPAIKLIEADFNALQNCVLFGYTCTSL